MRLPVDSGLFVYRGYLLLIFVSSKPSTGSSTWWLPNRYLLEGRKKRGKKEGRKRKREKKGRREGRKERKVDGRKGKEEKRKKEREKEKKEKHELVSFQQFLILQSHFHIARRITISKAKCSY